jgi:hypothetical protein
VLPPTAIVILNWNGWQDTIELLNSLNSASYEPMLVIVIDNASTDQQSVAKISSWLRDNNVGYSSLLHTEDSSMLSNPTISIPWQSGKYYLFIECEHNLGFCAGNNLGMELGTQLGSDYVLILNNDTLVQPDFLEPMIEIAESDPNVGLVGGIITYCDEPNIIWWAGGHFDRFLNSKRLLDGKPIDNLQAQAAFETEWVSGCMMLIPTRIYREFGGYFEDYFIWSEEWDYSLMVSRAGYKLMVAPQTRICHKVGRSLGIMKPLNYYYGTRNALILQHKYLPTYYWYPYLAYYLVNRLVRYAQLMLQGRRDLVDAGVSAITDFMRGRTGKWQRQST